LSENFPILEFDPSPEAILEPEKILHRIGCPEQAVLCFFQEVVKNLVERQLARHIFDLKSEIGENPVYQVNFNGKLLVVLHPGVGAPLAASFLEELIALGCRKFIACGGAGVLDSSIAVGNLLVPTAAIRDEGTSYHYLPPGFEVPADPAGVAAIQFVLDENQIPYLLTKTWTTDAIYRETQAKVQRRRAEGCLVVEMEAAALFAVANFRKVQLAQILYGGDDEGSETWDQRGWIDRTTLREKIFWLAAEACLRM
jgi:uridine phosphorylase